MMTDAELKHIENEINGVKARLRWTHLSQEQLEAYREKLFHLEQKLKNKDSSI